MLLRASSRIGWALSLTGLAAAGIVAAWHSGELAPLATGCDPAAIAWSYDVQQGGAGSQLLGIRFDQVPAACVGHRATVRFMRGGAVVATRQVGLGVQDVRADGPVDALTWEPVG